MKRCAIIAAVLASLAIPVQGATLKDAIDMYAAGDAAGAAAVYNELAVGGDAHAQFNLALMFYAGQGVPQSYSDAFVWAWRAKLQGIQQSQTLLAQVDPSISRDERSALAAVLTDELSGRVAGGDPRAMLAMSVIQSDLLPRPDMVQTYVWQSLAVVAGMAPAAQLRDQTFRALSARDQAKAQAAARSAFSDWCQSATTVQPACQVIN